jgi:hypothetical protein
MMSLEEKRIALQQQLEGIQEQMNDLRDQLFSEQSTAKTVRAAVTRAAVSPKPSSGSGKTQRSGRGELKERILSALQSAGREGIRVKELANELNTKPVNIHSWFHSAIKRHSAIKKISGGHYRLERGMDASSSPSKGAKTQKRTAVRGKAAAVPKSSATRSAGGRKAASGPSRRGELRERILSEMEGAGARGINVRELADRLGANYKNIHIWFSTTGKKNPKIKKVGKAQYRLES